MIGELIVMVLSSPIQDKLEQDRHERLMRTSRSYRKQFEKMQKQEAKIEAKMANKSK